MLTSELIEEVRSMTDEENENDLTPEKIIAALNRALKRLARLSVRHFPELLKRTYTATSVSGTTEITIPELSQAFTVTQVDAKYGGVYYPVIYTNTTNVTQLESILTSPIPYNYSQMGNKLLLYPTLSSGIEIRVRYELRPYELVMEQGRVTNFDVENGYIYLDAIGSELSTSVSDRSAFINVIDQFTGDIKGTYQIAAISAGQNRLTIKAASLDRDEVWGHEVGTELSSSISKDDYVCSAKGTCIPLYFKDYTDFLTQYATNDVKRSYGLLVETDAFALKDIEDDVKRMWASRPQGYRIQARNRNWNRSNIYRR